MESTKPRRSSVCALVATFVLATLALVAGAPAALADGIPLRHYDVDELASLMRNEGYGAVSTEENRIVFKAEGSQYVLFLYDDGDLQLYYGIRGVSVSADDINSWNRNKRLSRAYIDGDLDPVLEADLLANAGMNDLIISEFVKVFVSSAGHFRSFLREHDRATPAKPQPAASGRDI